MRIKLPLKLDRDTLRPWLIQYKDLSSKELSRKCGISIERIIQWRILYDVVDYRDKNLFTAWVSYKDYSISEASILLGITQRAFRYYLDKYNIDKYRVSDKQFSDYCSKPTECQKMSRRVMRDEAAMRKLYKKYGKRILARMFDVSNTRILYVLRKFGILDKDRKWTGNPNPCKCREWLVQKFIMEGKNFSECAEEAGVCPHTIRNWLIQFGIRPRDIYEAPQVRNNKENARVLTCTA